VADWQTLYAEDVAKLSATFGRPVTRTSIHDVGRETFEWWSRVTQRRTSEVVMLVRRPGPSTDRFVVHTKAFYPSGAYRLLSGGLHLGEDLLVAALREAHEETGLDVRWDRFLAIIHNEFRHQGESIRFLSYLVAFASHDGEIVNQDEGEQITDYREVSLAELDRIADALEALPPNWVEWGRFRAPAHRLAVELLSQE